jgi:HAD superfamily hydrolase (TIGR01509 family)
MTSPKAVVFDIGRVLLDFDYRIAIARLADHCALTADQLRHLLDQSPLLHRYESGHLSDAEFFARFQSAAAFRGDLEAFAALFRDIFTPIEPMVRLHARLRERGVPTFVLSNTNHLQFGHIRQRYSFFAGFSACVLSFEHGVMKPDPRLYEVLERVSGRTGPELFYLDDRPENIDTARARGWQAIVHENPEASHRAVQATGLLG